MWSSIRKVFAQAGSGKGQLTDEMCAEIDRLGLAQSWFQRVNDEHGLASCKSMLSHYTTGSLRFDRWYPRLVEFAAEKRRESPMPDPRSISLFDAAIVRILQPKIRGAEHVPCPGNYTAAIFTAPLCVLPLVKSEWPANYRHHVFLTPDELKEWYDIYPVKEDDEQPGWCVYQTWGAQRDLLEDPRWECHVPVQERAGGTPVMITWSLSWGMLAGGGGGELWHVDSTGKEKPLGYAFDATY